MQVTDLESLVETANRINYLAQSQQRYTNELKNMTVQVNTLLQRIDEVDDRIATVTATLASY
ncbi:Hypothetical protein GLP15_202 [Giardia lamblia P15]|uniref:Uncharacterized protein n=1 Tax=Giardia intestinalis (strain P15) TaxID=658858 RepID=E1F1H3_GIAIA|nr:Hypothetical protein GLP15_202 [Giardia lamblia P15]